MGLRIEPKAKLFDPKRYDGILDILREAQLLSHDSHVFYDPDKGEELAKTRKDFLYVAGKEGLSLSVRRGRGQQSLQLIFGESATRKRISAEEARERVLTVLGRSAGTMKKADILSAARISEATWNLRIRELIDNNKVKRIGNRRDTVYTLV